MSYFINYFPKEKCNMEDMQVLEIDENWAKGYFTEGLLHLNNLL